MSWFRTGSQRTYALFYHGANGHILFISFLFCFPTRENGARVRNKPSGGAARHRQKWRPLPPGLPVALPSRRKQSMSSTGCLYRKSTRNCSNTRGRSLSTSIQFSLILLRRNRFSGAAAVSSDSTAQPVFLTLVPDANSRVNI